MRYPTFDSFESCNLYLCGSSPVGLTEYVHASSSIPMLDHHVDFDVDIDIINRCVEYVIYISNQGDHSFNIPISALYDLGIDYKNFASSVPHIFRKLIQRPDDKNKMELRMLNHFGLYDTMDYTETVSRTTSSVIRNLNKASVVTILNKHYGNRFTCMVLNRVSAVLYNYNEYCAKTNMKRINQLRATIDNLTNSQDIFTPEGDDIRVSYSNECISESFESYDSSSILGSDVILEPKGYIGELTDVHQSMASFIDRVDGRMSNVDSKLELLSTRVNELVESISTTSVDFRHSSIGARSEISYLNLPRCYTVIGNERA